MSENSKIEWCDHTFSPWWGCMKVSEGCKNCYAETLDNRWKGDHWGPGSTRRVMSESYWHQPVKWNAAAKKAGIRAKVFCASMADVFEGHPDTEIHLGRLIHLILDTPYLIWQLLTKRPENILRLAPLVWQKEMPHNVWIGTSVENQAAADERIPHLLRIPASVRFLSCEPLLGPVDLSEYAVLTETNSGRNKLAEERGWWYDEWSGGFIGPGQRDTYDARSGIQWVIAGGESGPHARPMHPDWARSLRDQCQASDVPFFFKQWGEWAPSEWRNEKAVWISQNGKVQTDRIAATKYIGYGMHPMAKVGKKAAGRPLDGVEYNEFPKP